MENIKLISIDIKEFKNNIYKDYKKIFPIKERKSIREIKLAYKKGYTKIIKILENETLVGFMTLNRINNEACAVLDYFAILPEYRNKGIGTKAIKELIKIEQNRNGIFIEIEKTGLGKNEAENEIRLKRQKFYEQVGFNKLKYDLELYNVMYIPYIYLNKKINEVAIIQEVMNIYEALSGKRRTKRNCKFIKN